MTRKGLGAIPAAAATSKNACVNLAEKLGEHSGYFCVLRLRPVDWSNLLHGSVELLGGVVLGAAVPGTFALAARSSPMACEVPPHAALRSGLCCLRAGARDRIRRSLELRRGVGRGAPHDAIARRALLS